MLLDRPPVAAAARLDLPGPGEKDSGRTATIYGDDSSAIDLGHFEIKRGRRLAGRVVFADGKAIPDRMHIVATSGYASGRLQGIVDDQGRFELLGLPESEVHVWVRLPELKNFLPPGYRLSARNKCVDPLSPHLLVGRLDRDVDDLTILFEPGEKPDSNCDPGALEDFKEAKSGTIAGAPAETVPQK